MTGLSQQLLAYYCDPKDTNINISKYRNIYIHKTCTRYVQSTYRIHTGYIHGRIQNDYVTIYPVPKTTRPSRKKKSKIGSTFQPRLEGLLKMAANTDKYRINEIFKLAANLFLELGNFRVYSQHNVLI